VARLYSNENFPLPVVEELRRLGHDVFTIQEHGRAGEAVPDEDVLRFSAAEDRALLTLNRRDFIRLHNQQSLHAGIIVCTVDPDFAGQAHRIHYQIEATSDLHGQLIRVNRPSSPQEQQS
jgi:hypothetical protein